RPGRGRRRRLADRRRHGPHEGGLPDARHHRRALPDGSGRADGGRAGGRGAGRAPVRLSHEAARRRYAGRDRFQHHGRAAMATIYDVAARAGVSPATVSRVFNGTSVSPAKVEAVRAAAAELNFTPNRAARTLRRQSSEVIALIIPDIENPY